ncbi:hypothetical protein SAY87_014799 [Trapa incisa]|uniref:Uncharacterized protein n=1 Tax=Trapa incisa TaxID=236973 RepID=A0AAN7GNT8_9MYRT|nr:hypothetical protein SAY87_014799 [Trapa incisa]
MVDGNCSIFTPKDILHRSSDFEVLVVFEVGATSLSVLRSVSEAYWLHAEPTGDGEGVSMISWINWRKQAGTFII